MRLFLQRQSCSQMAHSRPIHFSWTNEDLPCLFPEGCSSEVKGCWRCCDRIKAFFNLSVCLCRSIQLLRTFDSTGNTWPLLLTTFLHTTVSATHHLLCSWNVDGKPQVKVEIVPHWLCTYCMSHNPIFLLQLLL